MNLDCLGILYNAKISHIIESAKWRKTMDAETYVVGSGVRERSEKQNFQKLPFWECFWSIFCIVYILIYYDGFVSKKHVGC